MGNCDETELLPAEILGSADQKLATVAKSTTTILEKTTQPTRKSTSIKTTSSTRLITTTLTTESTEEMSKTRTVGRQGAIST